MLKEIRFNFCSSSFLYNNIQSYRDKVLVIDSRGEEDYVCHALSGSISISNEQFQDCFGEDGSAIQKILDFNLDDLAEMMSQKQIEKFNQRKRSFCILLISEARLSEEFIKHVHELANADEFADHFEIPQKQLSHDWKGLLDAMQEKEAISIGLRTYELMQQDRVREIFILLDGAKAFFEKYPFMDLTYHPSPHAFIRSKSLVASKLDVTFNFPNDIWNSRLFLGSFNQASQDIIVQSLKVTHIVNVTAECENIHKEKGIQYLHIVVLDESQVTVKDFFKEAFEFIESALTSDQNNKVLLHCALGKSRSATITIMFLMKKFNWSFEKALQYVKMRRRIVDPNYGFLKQLEEFEKSEWVF